MAASKYEFILKAYDEVNALTKHEDQKAERSLTAMAFLTIAASTVFAATISASTYEELSPNLFTAATALFIAFVVLVAGGTFLVLFGIFPRFNIPLIWRSKSDPSKKEPQEPRSIFFGIEIGQLTSEAWSNYWDSTPVAELAQKALENLVLETHLIAGKVRLKVRWTGWGARLFLASLFPLAGMLILVALSAIY